MEIIVKKFASKRLPFAIRAGMETDVNNSELERFSG